MPIETRLQKCVPFLSGSGILFFLFNSSCFVQQKAEKKMAEPHQGVGNKGNFFWVKAACFPAVSNGSNNHARHEISGIKAI